MSNYNQELEAAREAARRAGDLIRSFQSDKSFNISLKGKNDLVTDADVAAENKIKEIINKNYPDDEFMAEESTHKDQLSPVRTWIIDPIDGTTNFVHGFPVYCVSIALWENQQPKVGVVLEVKSGDLFEATAGEGAYLDGERIHVSGIEEGKNSLIGTGFPYKNMSMFDHYLDLFRSMMHNTHGVRRAGAAAYDLCLVACGKLDGFYEYGLHSWDIGAGALIIKEAGGVISDWKGGDDWLTGERIVAGNSNVHKFLLEEIRRSFDEVELEA